MGSAYKSSKLLIFNIDFAMQKTLKLAIWKGKDREIYENILKLYRITIVYNNKDIDIVIIIVFKVLS